MASKDSKQHGAEDLAAGDRPHSMMSRRMVLRRGAAAMPAVLTLQSGAALARSSNMISAADSKPTDGYGRTLCLDENSVERADPGMQVMDLGEPAYGRVSAINERDYRREPRRRGEQVSEARMCENGGTYYYRRGGYRGRWSKVEVPKGMLVSATALSSFAGSIVVTDL